jgi:hypothetical protein
LDRALVSETKGRRFDPCQARHSLPFILKQLTCAASTPNLP